MEGEKIETVRDALIVMLRSLPSNGNKFNLVSFGSHRSALWEGGSRVYDQVIFPEILRINCAKFRSRKISTLPLPTWTLCMRTWVEQR